MSETKQITVTKVGDTAPTKPPVPIGGKRHAKKPKFGILKGGKTARKTPRFEAVADPAKAPPLKHRRKTLRILTERGLTLRRKRIADTAAKLPIESIRQTLRQNRIPVKDSTPSKIVRKIYEDAQEAGMLSS